MIWSSSLPTQDSIHSTHKSLLFDNMHYRSLLFDKTITLQVRKTKVKKLQLRTRKL